MDDTEAIRVVWRLARLHDRGIICPAVMWDEVVRVLDGPDPGRVLELTPPECRSSLRRIYWERPWSLRSERRDEVSKRVAAAVEQWCRTSDAEPGFAADGGNTTAFPSS